MEGKNIIIAILILMVCMLVYLAFFQNTKEISIKKPHPASTLSTSNNITCTYPQTLFASYQSGEIVHSLPKPEKNPIIMTFNNIQTNDPKIMFIDTTQTISEVPVIKILDDEKKLVFLEGNGSPYTTLHTIYKDSGVAIYEKSASLLNIPIGTMGMGSCVDY